GRPEWQRGIYFTQHTAQIRRNALGIIAHANYQPHPAYYTQSFVSRYLRHRIIHLGQWRLVNVLSNVADHAYDGGFLIIIELFSDWILARWNELLNERLIYNNHWLRGWSIELGVEQAPPDELVLKRLKVTRRDDSIFC